MVDTESSFIWFVTLVTLAGGFLIVVYWIGGRRTLPPINNGPRESRVREAAEGPRPPRADGPEAAGATESVPWGKSQSARLFAWPEPPTKQYLGALIVALLSY